MDWKTVQKELKMNEDRQQELIIGLPTVAASFDQYIAERESLTPGIKKGRKQSLTKKQKNNKKKRKARKPYRQGNRKA
jgi:hypothetical protein